MQGNFQSHLLDEASIKLFFVSTVNNIEDYDVLGARTVWTEKLAFCSMIFLGQLFHFKYFIQNSQV